MTLQDTNERPVVSGVFVSDVFEPTSQHDISKPAPGYTPSPEHARSRRWPQRLLEHIKQGERYQAYAYFLSTIL